MAFEPPNPLSSRAFFFIFRRLMERVRERVEITHF